jgi:hypothetical protein
MVSCFFLVAVSTLHAADQAGRLEGVVVNGTAGGAPLAGVEVVLRAGEEGMLVPVEQTVSDAQGRFAFDDLPVAPGLIYLPGANRGGVHYPGPRVQFRAGAALTQTTLTVYEAVSAPSPLVAEEHELDLQVETSALRVTETLVVDNPTKTAYVGEVVNMPAPITLRLAIPPGFERVTFYDEFHGRRFQAINGQAVTDIPWPPGRRTLKYTYRLPVEEHNQVFERKLDLPCARLRVILRGEGAGHAQCNLPRSATAEGPAIVFESNGASLPAGHVVRVTFGALPTPWIAYAKGISLAVLAALVLGTIWFGRRRRPTAKGAHARRSVGRHRKKRRDHPWSEKRAA